MKKKCLLVTDSHGADYGNISYATLLEEYLGKDCVDRISYGGRPVSYFVNKINEYKSNQYEFCIIQIGNPDINPRMPYKLLKQCRNFGLKFMRDALFSIPPTFSISFLLRSPFFLIRLVLIRFYKEFYSDKAEILDGISSVYNNINADYKIILPLFYASPLFYTRKQNSLVTDINNKVLSLYEGNLLSDQLFNLESCKKYYKWDLFHFNDYYHNEVHKLILTKISNNIK